MKKTLFTLSFVTFFACVGQAQAKSDTPAKKEQATQATEQINADGTKMADDSKKAMDGVNKQEAPKDGTRMAITQKGVPASKSTQKEAKEMKTTDPKQAAKTEKQ